jgi:hypothetical protein
MSLLNSRKLPILILLGIVLVVGVVIIGLWLAGPSVGCTLMGCQSGLHINLAGLSSPYYQVSVSFPSGETNTLACSLGIGDESNPFENSCSPDGVFFRLSSEVAPPRNVTVTVVVEGKTYSQDFTPSYEQFRPNGKRCPPTCYSATIEMKLTP